jgi:Glycosyltransferase
MRRVVIFHGYPGHGAGAERVLEYLLQGAVHRRDEICLLAPASATVSRVAKDLGYSCFEWRSCKDALPQNSRAFLRTAARHRSPLGDIVHAWHSRGLEWAWLLGRRWNIPGSGTLHDDPEHTAFGTARKWIVRTTARHLDGMAVVSDGLKRRCEELGWSRELTVLRNGLPDALKPIRTRDKMLRIGFMAVSSMWKGIGMLPDLIERTKDLPLHWNLFGLRSSETAPVLDALSQHQRVTYSGVVPLIEALPRMDILLHLSLALDPYPTVLLEAARAGLPAIATNTGGSPEIVVHEKTGLLVPPGDLEAVESAIRRLVTCPETRKELGAAARSRFEQQFRVERMVADYFAFWDGLRSARR